MDHTVHVSHSEIRIWIESKEEILIGRVGWHEILILEGCDTKHENILHIQIPKPKIIFDNSSEKRTSSFLQIVKFFRNKLKRH